MIDCGGDLIGVYLSPISSAFNAGLYLPPDI